MYSTICFLKQRLNMLPKSRTRARGRANQVVSNPRKLPALIELLQEELTKWDGKDLWNDQLIIYRYTYIYIYIQIHNTVCIHTKILWRPNVFFRSGFFYEKGPVRSSSPAFSGPFLLWRNGEVKIPWKDQTDPAFPSSLTGSCDWICFWPFHPSRTFIELAIQKKQRQKPQPPSLVKISLGCQDGGVHYHLITLW